MTDPPSGKAQEGAPGGATSVDVEAGPGGPQEADRPRLSIEAQYVKDLSFENPRAPASLVPAEGRPDIQVDVEVRARALKVPAYEVELAIKAEAKREGEVLFILDLVYAGVARLSNVQAEAVQAVLLIECPRLLFPFAREVVADATRDGGFPPLMLNPIDFLTLYHRTREPREAQAPAGASTAAGKDAESP